MKPAILCLLILSAASIVWAQTGTPPFGSFHNEGFDTINRGNLNVNFAIPIMSQPGRGQGFGFTIVYDTLIWKKTTTTPITWTPVVDQNGNPTWGWKKEAPKGKTTFEMSLGRYLNCGGGFWDYEIIYSNFAHTDMAGTRHQFAGGRKYNPCTDTYSLSVQTYALDKSGYWIDATWPFDPLVKNPVGENITSAEIITDTNGNYVTKTVVSPTVTEWKDTLGRVVLKIEKKTGTGNCGAAGGGSFPECYEYTYRSADNAQRTAKLFLDSFNVKTNFACTGVTEYNQTGKLLPKQVDLANGKSYVLTYEPTPGDSSKTTGRLKRITLPTGGYYEYRYPGSNPSTDHNGINCTDTFPVDLTRAISENGSTERVWTFIRTQVGSDWKTRITPPTLFYDSAANESTFTFSSAGYISTKIYQGTEASGTLLRTITTTWAANGTPSSQTVVLEDTPGSTKLQTKSDTIYDDYGNLKELKEYDYGSGAPPSTHVRKTTMTYLHESISAYLTRNIINRVKSVRLDDASGNKKSEAIIEYDQGTLEHFSTAPPQYDHANYSHDMLYRGNPTEIKRWLTGSTYLTTTNVYDEVGNLRSVKDPNSQGTSVVSTISYSDSWSDSSCAPPSNSLAYPTTITNKLSQQTQIVYFPCTGQIQAVKDANDIANSRAGTTFLYDDSMRRIKKTSFHDGGEITVAYTDSSNQVSATQKRTSSDSISVTDVYNNLGMLKQRQLPASRKVDIEYNEQWGQWKVYNPYVSTGDSTFGYVETRVDALGRVKLVRKQDTNTVSIEYKANETQITNEVSNKKITVADALGRVTKVCEVGANLNGAVSCGVSGFMASGYITTYTHNERNQMTQFVQGNHTRDMTYDNAGRLTNAKILEIATGSTVDYEYDNNGNRIAVKDPRSKICFEYDALDRLKKKYHAQTTDTCPTGTVVAEFVYDGGASSNSLGRLRTAWDGLATNNPDKTQYTFDALGRVTNDDRTVSGTTYSMTYTYDLMGNVVDLTYPSSSGTRRKVTYAYKTTGELDKVSDTTGTAFDYVSNTQYSNLGPLKQMDFGSGTNPVRTELSWNTRGLIGSILTHVTGGGATLLNLGYIYNADGKIQQIKFNNDPNDLKTETYTYDALGRLLTALRGPTSNKQREYNYEYDRYGNRTKQDWVAGPHGIDIEMIFSTANNRTLDTPPYAYDGSGNLTQNHQFTATNSFTYNPENFNVTAPNSTYAVDAIGRRVKKTVSGTTTDTFYIGSEIIAEKTGSNWKDYIFFAGQRIAEQTGATASTAVYLHTDHLGSTRLCTDSSGGNAGTCDYEPFGERQPNGTCSVPTKFRFAGMEWDSESDLYHTWFRQYDTRQGRWMGVDPLAGSEDSPQTLDRYSYVLNDPVNLKDPLGLECWTLWDVWALYEHGYGYVYWYATPIGTYCDDESNGGQGGGQKTSDEQAAIDKARHLARLQLSNRKCADFLKGVLGNLDLLPNLDAFLANFDHMTIVPTPEEEGPNPGYTAHVDTSGPYGLTGATVHVDAPLAPDLVPTLLHETFHTNAFNLSDYNLAKAVGAKPALPGKGITQNQANKLNSRAASAAFNEHCTPK